MAQNINLARGAKQILQEVSIVVQPGAFTAVLGPNGAGKSTLLKVLSGEIEAGSGNVMLNWKELGKYKAHELSLIRAVLPQSVQVNFPFTAREIVQLGRLPHREPRSKSLVIANKVMEDTNIMALADRKYIELSGGEQQRVQLARVIAQITREHKAGQPRFLLFDEPTSSLDIAQQHAMLHIAKELTQQEEIGVLAILHDMNLAAQYADEVLFMKNGKTVAQGKTAELMQEDVLRYTFSHPVQVLCNACCGKHHVMTMPLSKSHLLLKKHPLEHV
ncbi:heme ABC transporter ATP-binding protein [Pontibacter silvestris]|uniref:heme ABC transporter ATP-binding protein n=1 Tax=Pontibacter silvestris TaxID=2305183 RepID=UPI003A9530E7